MQQVAYKVKIQISHLGYEVFIANVVDIQYLSPSLFLTHTYFFLAELSHLFLPVSAEYFFLSKVKDKMMSLVFILHCSPLLP